MTVLPGFEPPQEHVYYATDGLHIKIGRTSDVQRRGGELHAQILFTLPGGELIERREHGRWSPLRIPGTEWFIVSRPMLVWITFRVNPRDASAINAMEWLALNLDNGKAA